MEKEIPLGVGSFGTVRLGIKYSNLGTHIKTTKLYAIKIVTNLLKTGRYL